MFLSKSLCMSIAERKKSEHLLRCNERYTQPGAQMGKTLGLSANKTWRCAECREESNGSTIPRDMDS